MRYRKHGLLLVLISLLGACAAVPPAEPVRQPLPHVDTLPPPPPGASTAPSAPPPQAILHTGTAALDKLLLEGEAQRRAGKLTSALDTLERALRLAPRAPEVYVALARVQLDQREFAKAEQMAQRALSRLGDNDQQQARRQRAEAWYIIANARRALGQHDAADAAQRNAVGIW